MRGAGAVREDIILPLPLFGLFSSCSTSSSDVGCIGSSSDSDIVVGLVGRDRRASSAKREGLRTGSDARGLTGDFFFGLDDYDVSVCTLCACYRAHFDAEASFGLSS